MSLIQFLDALDEPEDLTFTIVAGVALLGAEALVEGDFECLSDLAGACLDFLLD